MSIIGSMRPTVASGPDGISARMLQGCAHTISGPLSILFNSSLSAGKVPSDWKLSNVTPIFKAGDPSMVCNYRPISLLPLPSKIMERNLHNALMDHLLEHDLLSSKQFGFRPGSSTQEALLSATRDWHSVLDDGASVGCVFFDLAKAFDSLPHSLILDALSSVGVQGPLYGWLTDYLSDRRQRVVLDGSISPAAAVTSGVPQGSILGPLLFLLSVDPLLKLSFSITTTTAGFADDTVLYRPIRCTEDKIALQSDVTRVVQWVEESNLRLNKPKTKFMVISRKRQPPSISLFLGDSAIEQVDSYKLLGLTITEDLSWSRHISNTSCKASRLVGFLYRNFRGASSSSLTYLYKALVRPVLDYCGPVWDPHHRCDIDKLEKVQVFAARLATGRWTGRPDELRATLGLPLLSARRSYQKLCLCRRILTGGSIIPGSVFTPHPSSSVRHANSVPLSRPYVRTCQHQSSYFRSE